MVPALLHHTQASNAVRFAQLAAISLTAVVVAVLAFGPRSGERPVPALTLADPGTKPVAPTVPEKPQHHADAKSIALALGQLGNSPKPSPKPETTSTPEPTPTPVASEESVRFLGALTEPGRRLALLKVNDRQRLLAPGEKIESITVIEVGPDFVVVEDSHGQRRLTKGERQGPAVTFTTASSGAASSGSFNSANANNAADVARAAMRARSDPAQLNRQVQTNIEVLNSSTTRSSGEQNP